jgi:hypothetical protein
MAFTATITTIQRADGQIRVVVTYADSATGFTAVKPVIYTDDGTITKAQVLTDIQTQGQQYKTNLTTLNTLQGAVGTVLTI